VGGNRRQGRLRNGYQCWQGDEPEKKNIRIGGSEINIQAKVCFLECQYMNILLGAAADALFEILMADAAIWNDVWIGRTGEGIRGIGRGGQGTASGANGG